MRDERRLFDAPKSEKLAWLDSGGRGDREREVERELCSDWDGRVAMWIERESRREDAPVPQPDGAPTAAVAAPWALRVIGASGRVMVEAEGLMDVRRSHLLLCCLRREDGLIEVDEDAVKVDGDEWECVS